MKLRRVLVPVDFSPVTERVLAAGQDLARSFGADLALLHVLEDYPIIAPAPAGSPGAFMTDFQERRMAEAQRGLKALEAQVPQELRGVAELHRGDPARLISEAVTSLGADVVLMSWRSHALWQRFLLGSVTSKVLRTAACPVLVWRDTATDEPPRRLSGTRRLLFTTDLSEPSWSALPTVEALVRHFSAEVDVVLVQPDPMRYSFMSWALFPELQGAQVLTQAERRAREAVDQRLARASLGTVRVHVVHGLASEQIVRLAETQGTDMIIMSSHGRNSLQRALLGSTTSRVVQTAPCPVWVARPPVS